MLLFRIRTGPSLHKRTIVLHVWRCPATSGDASSSTHDRQERHPHRLIMTPDRDA